MKNNIDFIYEYSDLNLFNTRAKILSGEYSGIVLEFGSSNLMQYGKNNLFTFDYILYEVPDQFYGPSLRMKSDFNEYLGYLLVAIIKARKSDKFELKKLHEAASYIGKQGSDIVINEKWYPHKLMIYKKEQPKTSLGDF